MARRSAPNWTARVGRSVRASPASGAQEPQVRSGAMMRWRRGWVVVVAALASLAACSTVEPAAPAAPPDPSATATGAPDPADGIGRIAGSGSVRHVGALFHAGGPHFCSGTLVAGGATDLVVTAAHCVASGRGGAPYTDLAFAPAFRGGTAPHGMWRASRITVDPRWSATGDADLDVAFVALAPRDGERASDVVGADRIGFDPPTGGPVRLTGYPRVSDDPLTCVGILQRQSPTQLRVDCTGFSDGTSGSPWLTGWDPATATGTVVGVIGGYQLGGDTEDVSYSAYFGADVGRLYEQATT
jgi:V8-like Glu-specific endopeptidase